MQILISMICALIVITAYCMGVWTGSRFYCPDGGKGHLLRNSGRTGVDGKMEMDDGIVSGGCLEPVELRKRPLRGNTDPTCADLRKSESAGSAANDSTDAERQKQSADVLTDKEKQKRFEEDLKAFQDCMNYCLEKAYGVET